MLFEDNPNVGIITSEMLVNEQPDKDPVVLVHNDNVRTSPSHYSRLQPQTIQRLQEVLTPEEFQGFCRGNILKYAERMRYKDEPVKEAKKIVDYANWLYQSLNGEKVKL